MSLGWPVARNLRLRHWTRRISGSIDSVALGEGVPEPGRSLAPADLAGEVGLDEGEVVGVGDADAPAFGPAAPGTGRRRRASDRRDGADDLGQENLGVGRPSSASVASAMAARKIGGMAGPNPQRFIETTGRRAPGGRPRPSLARYRPSRPRDLATLVDPTRASRPG